MFVSNCNRKEYRDVVFFLFFSFFFFRSPIVPLRNASKRVEENIVFMMKRFGRKMRKRGYLTPEHRESPIVCLNIFDFVGLCTKTVQNNRDIENSSFKSPAPGEKVRIGRTRLWIDIYDIKRNPRKKKRNKCKICNTTNLRSCWLFFFPSIPNTQYIYFLAVSFQLPIFENRRNSRLIYIL